MATEWFQTELRVRYQETDQMGVVYHANYLNWFEIGRTEMIRQLGIPYQHIEERGLLLPVVHAELQFRSPAKYDDVLLIHTRVASFTYLKLEFEVEIRRKLDSELLVQGKTKHVWINREWKPTRVDKIYPELYELIRSQVLERGE